MLNEKYPETIMLAESVHPGFVEFLRGANYTCLSDGEFGRTRPGLWAANYSIVQGGFFWMSDNEVPVDVRRPYPLDNSITTSQTGADVVRYLMVGGFPGILLLLALFIWIRRRSR